MEILTGLIAFCTLIPLMGFLYSLVYWNLRGARKPPYKTMVVLGSGGHTAEMSKLRSTLNENIYSPRIYVSAKSDEFSVSWMEAVEDPKKDKNVIFENVYRIREVGQSWITTLLISLPISFVQSVYVYLKHRPSVVLTNGPGICVPFMLIAKIFKIVGVWECDIVYIESVCRVTTMSLSGRAAIWLADLIFVQWPELFNQYKSYSKVKYIGRLT